MSFPWGSNAVSNPGHPRIFTALVKPAHLQPYGFGMQSAAHSKKRLSGGGLPRCQSMLASLKLADILALNGTPEQCRQ